MVIVARYRKKEQFIVYMGATGLNMNPSKELLRLCELGQALSFGHLFLAVIVQIFVLVVVRRD